jgi:hypothetical protein
MKRLAMAAILVIALLVPTLAGEVPTVGKAEPQPQPTPTQTTSTTNSTSTVSTILLTLISLGLVGR